MATLRRARLGEGVFSGPGRTSGQLWRSPFAPAELTLLHRQGNSLLKALRLWRKKGQAELAKEIGTSQGYISDLENRRRHLTPKLARELAVALDVPERWLPDS
jgi:DNA-binding XRE family transcriptional regulator